MTSSRDSNRASLIVRGGLRLGSRDAGRFAPRTTRQQSRCEKPCADRAYKWPRKQLSSHGPILRKGGEQA